VDVVGQVLMMPYQALSNEHQMPMAPGPKLPVLIVDDICDMSSQENNQQPKIPDTASIHFR
jgi:hypothetical protein